MLRKTVFAAAGAAAVAVGLALGGAGTAYAAPIYADTSVTADNQVVDAITGTAVTASYTPWTCTPAPPATPTSCMPGSSSPTVGLNSSPTPVPAFSTASVTYNSADSLGNPLTYSIVGTANVPSTVSLGISGDTVTLTPVPGLASPCPGVAVTNTGNISLTVKVTDGTAIGFETLTAVPTVDETTPIPGCSLTGTGWITSLSVTAATDTVTLAGSNNNTTGAVDFTSTPAGASFTLANAPDGVALTGSHLAGTDAIPSTEDYPSVAVTATDAMGATAVDTFKLDVYGNVLASDTPRLSGGHAIEGINASRENVYFVQSGQATCDHFTIVGPGAINGHQGWVPAQLGLNAAAYGGLLQHHGYTVYYQPVSGPANCSTHSTALWPGAHWGYVYFVTA